MRSAGRRRLLDASPRSGLAGWSCIPCSAVVGSSICWSAISCRGSVDMHELALTQSIVEMVAEHAQGRTVKRVTLEVGKLTCVMPDALRFCFDLVAAGTALDGAKLDIREIEGRARCATWGGIHPTH